MTGHVIGPLLACVIAVSGFAQAPNTPLNVIAFGAHPDDCDIRAGGVAAKYAALGHHVRFVSVTNGDAGHQTQGGGALAARRRAEAKDAGRRIGIEYIVLDNHDGELMPTLAVRDQIIRQMREWHADLVLAPRPNDYHPDHRYTGILVQDAAYMVTVPNVAPDTPALRKNPTFMYFQDGFQKPAPFAPDVAVSIDDVFDRKIDMLDAHVSQVYEWLPWHDGALDRVPKDPADRKRWLREQRQAEVTPAVRAPRWGSGMAPTARRRSSRPRRSRSASTEPGRRNQIYAGCFRSFSSGATINTELTETTESESN